MVWGGGGWGVLEESPKRLRTASGEKVKKKKELWLFLVLGSSGAVGIYINFPAREHVCTQSQVDLSI